MALFTYTRLIETYINNTMCTHFRLKDILSQNRENNYSFYQLKIIPCIRILQLYFAWANP